MKMDQSKLKSLLKNKIKTAMGYQGGELSDDRQKLFDSYLGEPYGNEAKGKSAVVTREVFETVEWIKPSLLRTFTAGERVVEFDPVGSGDEDQAKQETDYCNYVFNKDNNGFMVAYEWITDALLQRNGTVKVYWDESEDTRTEYWEGLTPEQLAAIDEQENTEIIEATERTELIQVNGGMIEASVYDVRIRITQKKGRIKVDCVPPEEVLVSKNATSIILSEADFICHHQLMTISELVEMGYSFEELESLGDEDDKNFHDETENRNYLEDEWQGQQDEIDPSLRELDVYECYINVDYDGDGIAERRRIFMVGMSKIMENEEDSHTAFIDLCSVPLSHKRNGLCVADAVMDLQKIMSTVMRQYLDALYTSNNARYEYSPRHVTHVGDLLNPKAHVRVKEIGHIKVMENGAGQVAANALPALQELREQKESRTGISRTTMGLDANAIAKSTKGAFNRALDEAHDRIEIIARIFAETGFKELFKSIRKLAMHHDAGREVKLGNQWAHVIPKQWGERDSMTVNVGLGNNNKDALMSSLMTVIQEQKESLMNGLPHASPGNLYNSYKKLTEAAGLKNPDLYWTDPATIPPAPPEEDPNDKVLQLQQQITQLQESNKFEIEQMKQDMKRYEIDQRTAVEIAKAELQHDADIAKQGQGAELNG